jgi:4-amino-4-deoxy-L-arabinose transferase-like glycosyltransferase
MRSESARAALIGAAFAALITLPGLGNGTLWDNSETAYGEVAREIVLGHDWLVMHLNGLPWFVQPPLYFWIAALFAKIFGVGAFAMRLPSALATIAMGGIVGYATARIAGTRAGIASAIVLSTSLMQAVVGRLAIMDAVLDLTIAGAILWWYRAFEPYRGAIVADRRKRDLALIGGAIAVAFGVLAKGPVAPVIAVLVIGVWLIWESRLGSTLAGPGRGAYLLAIVLAAAVAVPWFALLVYRVGFVATGELIGHYTVGRYTGVIENQRGPIYYYLVSLAAGFFPWIAFLPPAIVAAFRAATAREGAFARLALVWAIVPFVFFSFAQTKLPNYIALEWPALAILVGLWFERATNGSRRTALVAASTIPLFLAAIAVGIPIFAAGSHVNGDLGGLSIDLAIVGATMFVGSLLTVAALAIRRYAGLAPYVLGLASTIAVLEIVLVGEPHAEAYKPIPVLAAAIDARRQPGDIVAIRGVSGGNGLIFYTLPGVVTIDTRKNLGLGPSLESVVCTNARVFLVTTTNKLAQLPHFGRRVTTIRKFGKADLLLFDGPPHCR